MKKINMKMKLHSMSYQNNYLRDKVYYMSTDWLEYQCSYKTEEEHIRCNIINFT